MRRVKWDNCDQSALGVWLFSYSAVGTGIYQLQSAVMETQTQASFRPFSGAMLGHALEFRTSHVNSFPISTCGIVQPAWSSEKRLFYKIYKKVKQPL